MLTFTLYQDEVAFGYSQVDIDPAGVESVQENRRHFIGGGYRDVSVITLKSGVQHTVYEQDARRRVAEAKAILYERKMDKLRDERDSAQEAADRMQELLADSHARIEELEREISRLQDICEYVYKVLNGPNPVATLGLLTTLRQGMSDIPKESEDA